MEKTLCLTAEEAVGLLDILIVSPVEMTQEQRSAFLKLSEHCRQLLRDNDEASIYPARRGRDESFPRYRA